MYFTLEMPNPWDDTLRPRAVRAYEAGEGAYDELAALFEIGARTLQRWVQEYRAEGTLTPNPKGGGWRSPILLPLLHALVAEAPDVTCAELCWAYNRRAPAAHRTTPDGRGPRQPACAQGPARTLDHPGLRGPGPLPAAVLVRLQPDRERLGAV
jgi:transposase-like protein